jgi:hypothetical protein
MMLRAQELCRKLRPILGQKIDRLWTVYLAETDADGRADIEQTLELLALKHLGQSYMPDRSPFPPPEREFAASGDLRLGTVTYGDKGLFPFMLRGKRLKEHALIAGRSGSGKTNLTFVLMKEVMDRGIHVLALDWKRGYRSLLGIRPDIRVFTIGRDVSPFRFNPLIPPPGCEPNVWIKLIVDVISSSYMGGEGVISLLVAGLEKLYRDAGVYDHLVNRWPTIPDLLVWLKGVKLKGRAAMWQASAERILLAMTYGEFGAVVDTQDNAHIRGLLMHNVVLEMDGLSSNSDKVMFSEALALYLYRHRLAQGPCDELTNLIVLEEAHNLLHQKTADVRESVLENSIRMIREYGLGYIFVDQSASLLSKVAFANSYATLALSQKLRADVQTVAGAMNLNDEQKEALNTLPVGTVIVRLADEHPEPFLVRVPRFPVQEGTVSDQQIRDRMAPYHSHSAANRPPGAVVTVVPPIPAPDNNQVTSNHPRPPSPTESAMPSTPDAIVDPEDQPPTTTAKMTREEIRFLADLADNPLSTTVSRYHRLNLSRRRGNAVRQHLDKNGLIEAVSLATRSGQVVLYQLTDLGRAVSESSGVDPGPRSRESLEHRYWVDKAAGHFEERGFQVVQEHRIEGDGAIDLLAERPGERVAVEVETGKSDIDKNVVKLLANGFDRVVLLATSPAAVTACQEAAKKVSKGRSVEILTWLDIS